MRHKSPRSAAVPPLVGIWVGGATRVGREIFRGAFEYVRTHTRWRLAIDTGNESSTTSLPKCSAYIVAVWTDARRIWAENQSGILVNVSSRQDVPSHWQVRIDNFVIGRMAAEHFLDSAMSRFGYVGPSHDTQAKARLTGFEDTLRERGASCEVYDWTEHGGTLNWQSLLTWLLARQYPIAIFCNNDDTGRLVTQACWECDLAVPEQVAVLGSDNDEVFYEASQPLLSSIDPGAWRLGSEAARTIDQLLSGQTPATRDLQLSPLTVIRRSSTDIVAVQDKDLAAVLRFIREHACDGINVADVVRTTSINRRLLERRFAKIVGCSILEHIHRLRLRRAKELLETSSLPVKEVMKQTGFTYPQTFYRAFSKHFGVVPGAVRKASHPGTY